MCGFESRPWHQTNENDWRGVRVVDGATLERLCGRKSTGGSNPPPSAHVAYRVLEGAILFAETGFLTGVAVFLAGAGVALFFVTTVVAFFGAGRAAGLDVGFGTGFFDGDDAMRGVSLGAGDAGGGTP